GQLAAPIAALAYRPGGEWLAVGAQKSVLISDLARKGVVGKPISQPAPVTALAWSPAGDLLAVAHGTSGTAGAATFHSWDKPVPEQFKTEPLLKAHADLIHDLAFSPDGKILATTGYDRLIKLWDVATGKELRTLKDHSDAVYGIA